MSTSKQSFDARLAKMDNLFVQLRTEAFSSSDLKPDFVGCANFEPGLSAEGHDRMPIPLVSDVVRSSAVTQMEQRVQERVADATFRYLLQLELFNATVELGDRLHDDDTKLPASHQVALASTLQQQVIASRVVLECFFDLIHCTSKGRRMRGKSKFKSFRQWITSDRTPYNKFVPVILLGWRYDRFLRTPEVHGTSQLVYAILDGDVEKSPIWKVRFDLTNALQSSWTTLLNILNEREGGMWTTFQDHDVSSKIFELSSVGTSELEEYLERIFRERTQSPTSAG